jgi:hypothetical protein
MVLIMDGYEHLDLDEIGFASRCWARMVLPMSAAEPTHARPIPRSQVVEPRGAVGAWVAMFADVTAGHTRISASDRRRRPSRGSPRQLRLPLAMQIPTR